MPKEDIFNAFKKDRKNVIVFSVLTVSVYLLSLFIPSNPASLFSIFEILTLILSLLAFIFALTVLVNSSKLVFKGDYTLGITFFTLSILASLYFFLNFLIGVLTGFSG